MCLLSYIYRTIFIASTGFKVDNQLMDRLLSHDISLFIISIKSISQAPAIIIIDYNQRHSGPWVFFKMQVLAGFH